MSFSLDDANVFPCDITFYVLQHLSCTFCVARRLLISVVRITLSSVPSADYINMHCMLTLSFGDTNLHEEL